MRCDNICPRCGDPDEAATPAIFKYPPALQSWALAATPSHHNIFHVSIIYINIDYLFWRKNNIEDSEMDIDPYSWIIWYLYKTKNAKLFRGIDRDPLELIRYVDGECQAWFTANQSHVMLTITIIVTSPVLCFENICMVDGF